MLMGNGVFGIPCQKYTLPATNYCTRMEWYLSYRQWFVTCQQVHCVGRQVNPVPTYAMYLKPSLLSPHKRKQWTFLSTLRYGICHYMQGLYFVACTVPNLYSSFISPKTPISEEMATNRDIGPLLFLLLLSSY